MIFEAAINRALGLPQKRGSPATASWLVARTLLPTRSEGLEVTFTPVLFHPNAPFLSFVFSVLFTPVPLSGLSRIFCFRSCIESEMRQTMQFVSPARSCAGLSLRALMLIFLVRSPSRLLLQGCAACSKHPPSMRI